jgi:hypothetical protein
MINSIKIRSKSIVENTVNEIAFTALYKIKQNGIFNKFNIVLKLKSVIKNLNYITYINKTLRLDDKERIGYNKNIYCKSVGKIKLHPFSHALYPIIALIRR